MARYGLGEPFTTLATALFDAVHYFESARLPSRVAAFPGRRPTHYPVAGSPQPWAAGVVFHLVRGMPGFQAEAAANA
jgi:hypothetical protein